MSVNVSKHVKKANTIQYIIHFTYKQGNIKKLFKKMYNEKVKKRNKREFMHFVDHASKCFFSSVYLLWVAQLVLSRRNTIRYELKLLLIKMELHFLWRHLSLIFFFFRVFTIWFVWRKYRWSISEISTIIIVVELLVILVNIICTMRKH